MNKLMTLGFSLLFLASCSNNVEVNCESGNMSALEKAGETFIMDNIGSDASTRNMTFNNFSIVSSSCEANKREKYVNFTLKAQVRQSNKDRPISFNCRYTKASKSEKHIRCSMN